MFVKSIVLRVVLTFALVFAVVTAVAYIQGPNCTPTPKEEFPVEDSCTACLRVFPCWYCRAIHLWLFCECDGEGEE